MVKVQKPQPKTLKKSTKSDGVIKEKQKVNKTIKKSSKANGLAPAETKVDSKKISAIKSDVQKSSERKNPKVAVEPKLEEAKPPQKSKSTKRPLVLAPPKSPIALPTKTSKKAAPVATPVAAPAPKKAKIAKIERTASEPVLKSEVKQKAKAEVAKNKKKIKQIKQAVAPAIKDEAKKQVSKNAKASKKVLNQTKTKLANKIGANKKAKKGKISKKQKDVKQKKPKVVELKYEVKSFDEDKFNEIVCEKNVEKVCSALMSQVREEVQKLKSKPIFSDYRYILQVASYKIPSCPKRIVKLALKHSLVGKDDDVAVIVTDLQRGARFDYEPTVQHYEDLFREAGIEQRLKIVPFNQLRNDMVTFEAKRKFLNSYDYLLCDGRISGQATAFLGNFTQKPRNVLHSVRLSKSNQLPKEISRGLCRTAYRQLRKGDLIAIPVGNHEHSGQQLAENVLCVVKQLQQLYPGGLPNIRSMYLKIDIVGTSSLPLYISLCAPPVDAPYVVGPREQRMLKLKKQANEVLSRFALTKDVDFVKLTQDQVKRKAELRLKRNALKAEDAKDDENKGNVPEDSIVLAKKTRKNVESEKVKEDKEEEENKDNDEDDGDDDGDDDEDEDDDEVDNEEDEDDDNDNEEDEDDDNDNEEDDDDDNEEDEDDDNEEDEDDDDE
ncbi:PREDICTED: ribosomal L1 domain-containing protein CG13096 [Drosophila arizonae]|uniref:Ribosomal L1 domain-containing protein CG13096 n=1 Tax=Drosophila arizonae TaxID=7263 RepID=A0ABM1NP97_DROAR|nr:PREDICTED: ribosomal L1 domain-containing protein CG13096 [Drosophila arizonae]